MTTGKEVNQKISDVSMAWTGFLAELHRLINELEGPMGTVRGTVSSLGIPTKYMTREQQITNTITALDQASRQFTEKIAKLREFLRTY